MGVNPRSSCPILHFNPQVSPNLSRQGQLGLESSLRLKSQMPTEEGWKVLLTAPCPPGKYGYFSAKGANLDHPFFQVVGDDWTEVGVGPETRDEGKGSAVGGGEGGIPASRALPSSCTGSVSLQRKSRTPTSAKRKARRLPTVPYQAPAQTPAFRGVSGPPPAAPFLQAGKICPQVARGGQDSHPPTPAPPHPPPPICLAL